MRFLLLFMSVLAGFFGSAQNSVILADETLHDYGNVTDVYKLQSDFILKNTGAKNLYLLRADVGKNVKIWTSKKTVLPGDTIAVQVYYSPTETGKFSETIGLVTSADAFPFVLKIKGNVLSLKQDDKTACYYFKKKNQNNGNGTGLISNQTPKKPDSLKLAKNTHGFMNPDQIHFATQQIQLPPVNTPLLPTVLERNKYKPNNIVFLIDISGSMADSMKLPLMKISLQKLLDNLREEDRVTLITYRDTFTCAADSMSGLDKVKLKEIVAGLKAKGLTSGNKAIHYSLQMALKNYITEGNNQVILATDGRFFFREKDYQKWTALVGDKKVVLSVIALGSDDFALKNLQGISKKSQGSFIHIYSKEKAQSAVFDEIEMRSKK